MAARKKRPVLYEVYKPRPKPGEAGNRQRRFPISLGLGWKPAAGERPVETRGPASGTGSQVPPAAPSVSMPSGAAPSAPRQVTITLPTLAIVVAGVLVLLAVAFSAGRKYEAAYAGAAGEARRLTGDEDAAGARPPGGASDAQAQTAEPSAAEKGASGPPPGASAGERSGAGGGQPQITLTRGCHYVIVQHFGAKRDDALEAARFLQERGVPCALLPGKDIRVVATEPFLIRQTDTAAAQRERQRAERLLQRIRQIGLEFEKHRRAQNKATYRLDGPYLFEAS